MIEFLDSTNGFARSSDNALRMPAVMASKMQRLSFRAREQGCEMNKDRRLSPSRGSPNSVEPPHATVDAPSVPLEPIVGAIRVHVFDAQVRVGDRAPDQVGVRRRSTLVGDRWGAIRITLADARQYGVERS
jgi:hypothetical protein